jgi:tellurite resistance-related uncharacterized protein
MEQTMNFQQNNTLPTNVVKDSSTDSMTHETILKGILAEHKTAKGYYGYLVVEEGSLQFVWEDAPENIIDADKEHPILIEPERLHHVIITGNVLFHVEFYKEN